MGIQLKVDSTEFWTSLKQDIAEAQDYVYVQTLSFEGELIYSRGQRINRGAVINRSSR